MDRGPTRAGRDADSAEEHRGAGSRGGLHRGVISPGGATESQDDRAGQVGLRLEADDGKALEESGVGEILGGITGDVDGADQVQVTATERDVLIVILLGIAETAVG